ncbi:PAS domain-containing sensor histidine kinase [Leptospira ilyithenensis]|uniref:histidine kinase n=1 Tax=Leptospira ilyithenensis TaxID=2484901 RepID=A0A4R9LUT5_9LEPT|nr:PAS domain-containing sensor histidine kinase [Leptospira ilyithenensis]TGN14258.1 PAS domain S-box protein [Leptospira ilyithenensis]
MLVPDYEIYQLLSNISRELICLHTEDGTYSFVSPSSEKIIGYLPSELVGKNAYDFFHPEDRKRILEETHLPILKGETDNLTEYRFLHKNGSYVWLQTLSQIVKNNENQSVKIHTSSRDVSNQVELREKLIQRERLLRESNNVAKVGGWELDLITMKPMWSEMIFHIHEIEPPDIPPIETCISFFPSPGDEIVRESLMTAVEKGLPYDLTLPFVSANGKHKWVRALAKVEFLNDKPSRIYGALYDVTAQKNAELEKEISEKKFREAFHFSVGGLAITSIEGKFLEVNLAFSKFIGHSEEELKNMTIESVSHSADFEANMKLRRKVIANESSFFEMEKRYVHKDGHILWGHLSATLVRDKTGNPIYFISQVFDIDSRKKAELKLLLTNEKLTSVTNSLTNQNKQLQSYNQIVSHNLRSPISNLRTLLGLIDETEDPIEKTEYHSHLKIVAENLESTLEDLISALRIQQNHEIKPQLLDFKDSFERVQKLMIGEIQNLDAEIDYDFSSSPKIYFPKLYLESILTNLLSNSLKYSAPGKNPYIQVQSFSIGKSVTLSFTDNGSGIDLERYGKQIFQLKKTFHRGKAGRGVGLFLTKYQIESMGGQIEVRSQPGHGTTFLLHFLNQVNA